MEIEPHITFRGMEPSAAADARIRQRIAQLGKLHHRITACRVTVEAPHRHHAQGRLFRVAVDVVVPEAELVASHEHGQDHAHEDVYVAIRDAFDAVERQLTRTSEKMSPQRARKVEPE